METKPIKDLNEKRTHRYRNIIHLWEFLLELLADKRCLPIINWSRKEQGEFKLKNAAEVAKKWGAFKHKSDMTYDKLSRALRCYYRQGIIKKVKNLLIKCLSFLFVIIFNYLYRCSPTPPIPHLSAPYQHQLVCFVNQGEGTNHLIYLTIGSRPKTCVQI